MNRSLGELNMGKVFIRFLTFVFLLSTILVCSRMAAPPAKASENEAPHYEASNFLDYANPAYGIKIKYPYDCTKREEEKKGKKTVYFFFPYTSDTDNLHENLIVRIEDLSSKPMTLSEYVDYSINDIKRYFPDIKISESGETLLDSNSARKHVYTVRTKGRNIKTMRITSIKNNTVYIIAFLAEEDEYSKYLGTVLAMIDSFRCIENDAMGRVEKGAVDNLGIKIMEGRANVFYGSGRLKTAWLAEDTAIQGIKYKNGNSIDFYESGRIKEGVLAEDTAMQGIIINEGERVGFYDSGMIKGWLLNGDMFIQGIKYAGGSRISFYESGKVKSGRLVRNTNIQGRSFKKGEVIKFNEKGRIL
ncbi:MAG: PsbP-related protein [Candidatus Margulisiibacteriota bacterium]